MPQGFEHKQLIISDPTVMMGKPIIAGTRITVELILEKLAAGETIEEILSAHPRLTKEAIQAEERIWGFLGSGESSRQLWNIK